MPKSEKVLNIFKTYFPFVIIVAAAFLSTYVFFFKGLAVGDDLAFHLSMTNDVIYGFKHGYFLLSTNHLHMGGFALNNYGFYGPFTHYFAAIFTVMFEWAGATPSVGLKAVVVFTAILGGTFMYLLAMKMSKQNKIVSTISALIFVFLPYRIFCALARCAFAESVAICFIPVVFYGAYSLLNDEKYQVSAYVALCIGAIGVILSHAFTALITAFFGVIYLAFNAQKLFSKRNGFSIWPSLGISALIIVMCVGFYIGNAFFYSKENLYNFSDAQRQWTNYEHVAGSTPNGYDFSGFLNLIVIRNWTGQEYWDNSTVGSLIFDIILYFISMTLAVIADILLKKAPQSKWYKHGVATVVAFIFPILFGTRVEVWISISISLVVYFFITYLLNHQAKEDVEEVTARSFFLNPDFLFLAFSMIVTLSLIFLPFAWLYVPPIFYQAQFAWRLWGIMIFFVAMFMAYLLSKFKFNKPLLVSVSLITCSLVSMSMGVLEKRVYYEKRADKVVVEDGEEYAVSTKYSGAQNEAVPQIYYDTSYTPSYPNSLYFFMRTSIRSWTNYCYSIDDYHDPVFLEGMGDVTITEYNSPNNTFHVQIESESALVQFPQFYYQGYYGYVDGKKVAEGENVDGLVTFRLEKGEYDLKFKFKQSKICEMLTPVAFAGYALLIGGSIFGFCFYRKRAAKNEEQNTSN